MKWLNFNTLQGILRTILAFAGGILVSRGAMSADQVSTLSTQILDPQFIGAFIAITTGIWSVIHKTKPGGVPPSEVVK